MTRSQWMKRSECFPKAEGIAAKLAEGAEKYEEVNAEFYGAWAIWEEAQEKELATISEAHAAEAAVKSAALETNLAQSKVHDLEKQMGALTCHRTLLDSKAQQIDLAFQAMETLEKPEEVTAVSQDVDMGSCAAAVLAMDVETPMAVSVA